MFLQSISLFILHLLVLRVSARTDCTSLRSLSLPNVTITDAFPLTAGSTFPASADPTCFLPTYNNSVPICRVIGSVTTSPTSSVKFEMWLPDTWYGRVLTTGNGALGGCKLSFVSRISGPVSVDNTLVLPHPQASDTRSLITVPLSTLLRSPRTTGTMETSTQPHSSCQLASNPSPIFPIARCTWLRFSGKRSLRFTTAFRPIIRTITDVLREGDKEFPWLPSILMTLTVLFRGLLVSIGTISLALLGFGLLTWPQIRPGRFRCPSGARSLRRRFSSNVTDSMGGWMGLLRTRVVVHGIQILSYVDLRTTGPLV